MAKVERGRLPEMLTAVAILVSAMATGVSAWATYWYAKTTESMHEAQQAPYFDILTAPMRDEQAKVLRFRVELLNLAPAPALRVDCSYDPMLNGEKIAAASLVTGGRETSLASNQHLVMYDNVIGGDNFQAVAHTDVAPLRFTVDCHAESTTGRIYEQHWKFVYDRHLNAFRSEESTRTFRQ